MSRFHDHLLSWHNGIVHRFNIYPRQTSLHAVAAVQHNRTHPCDSKEHGITRPPSICHGAGAAKCAI